MTANVFSCNFHEFLRRSCTVDAAATAQQEEQIYFQAEKSQKVISSTPIRLQNSSTEWNPFAARIRQLPDDHVEDAPSKSTLIREGCHGAGLDVECPWCGNLIRFDGLSRHIVNSHLHVNAVGCECGGISREIRHPMNSQGYYTKLGCALRRLRWKTRRSTMGNQPRLLTGQSDVRNGDERDSHGHGLFFHFRIDD